jgi:hypothetical protein
MMSDDQRIYSDEEFALILRQAAELGSRAKPPGATPAGLTLAEMKAIAAQVGFDPALVERAARTLVTSATGSVFERLIGGPLRPGQALRQPETRAPDLPAVENDAAIPERDASVHGDAELTGA